MGGLRTGRAGARTGGSRSVCQGFGRAVPSLSDAAAGSSAGASGAQFEQRPRNTIDADAPSSSVDALPANTRNETFTVRWTGDDGSGSGIAGFDIFVSDNNGPFWLWLDDTTETSAAYSGEVSKPASLDNLIERMARNEFDLIAVGRALLQDPEWAVKIREGRNDELMDFSKEALTTLS